MEPAKILLLDLNSAADSGRVLRDIIESHFGPGGIELRREVVSDGDTFRPGELLEIIFSSRPDVIILIPSAALLHQTHQLLQSMRRACLTAPVVVVSETGEMFEWLKLGATDFIPAPFKADVVLLR